ncbi:MAG: histidine kinase [Burkholderiaceae bacterium]
MSAVAHLPPEFVDQRVRTRCVRAWTGLNRRHGLALALGTLLVAVHDISLLADKLARPGVGKIVVFDLFSTIVLFSITLLAWSAATYGHAPTGTARNRAIALAIVVSGVLASVVIVPLMNSIAIAEIWSDVMGRKQSLPPPLWIGILGNIFHLGLFSFLLVVAIEILHRRAATTSAIHASQQEQSSIARAALESRLAAMQAQVEPQFLFNTLVAIEALYQRNAGAAAENLDRLIQYLRVALPRLREPGSTVGAELDLVRAYLAVVTSLHGGRPALAVTVGDLCSAARFYPMLLLPLIQRAVREQDAKMPESIRIGVQKMGNDVVIVTRIACAGGCDEDFELARVRERLAGLYGDRAALECVELESNTTQFTLRVPADR